VAAAGLGSIDQAHTADEWIDRAELKRGVEFYRRFIESLAA
jgi:acetylornithine deacetylase/succinyl-diaminopimelate desuccinylase-like protein